MRGQLLAAKKYQFLTRSASIPKFQVFSARSRFYDVEFFNRCEPHLGATMNPAEKTLLVNVISDWARRVIDVQLSRPEACQGREPSASRLGTVRRSSLVSSIVLLLRRRPYDARVPGDLCER